MGTGQHRQALALVNGNMRRLFMAKILNLH